MDDRDSVVVGYCEQCGEPIYVEDERYELPDGLMFCAIDDDCLLYYAYKHWKTLGGIDVI